MEETKKRNKPKFLRRDSHKKIKLGKGVKSKQKWRAAKGRHNKIRLNRRGYSKRPKVGFGENKELKDKILLKSFKMVNNLQDLNLLKSGENILIASVGKKKKQEIISKAKEMKLIILNKYKNGTEK
jgi:large subunit ribosomal protein L32e